MKAIAATHCAVCLSLAFFALILAGQSFAAVTVDDVVGIWFLDEGKGDVTADASGNGNDGKLMNEPTWAEAKFGASALDFDALDDLVRIDIPAITLSSWAMVAWVYPRDPASEHYQGVIQAWPNQGEFQIQSNTGAIGVHPVYGGSLIADEWSHVAASVENDNVQVYINGEEVIQGAVAAATFSQVGLGDLYDCPDGFNYKFDGVMDDVAIFNRSLAEDEIEDIMTNGLAGALGIGAAVEPSGKLATTWSTIKSY